MLFKTITSEFITNYGTQLKQGTLTEVELDNLYLQINSLNIDSLNKETKQTGISLLDVMIDIVCATAPFMTSEALNSLVEQLLDKQSKIDKAPNTFMRNSNIAKCYLAYQACFFPDKAKVHLNGPKIKQALALNDTNPTVAHSKFLITIIGSSKISLLFHMAKDKAMDLNNHPEIDEEIQEMLKKRTVFYSKLAMLSNSPKKLPDAHKYCEDYIASLIKYNQTLTTKCFQPTKSENSMSKLITFFRISRSSSTPSQLSSSFSETTLTPPALKSPVSITPNSYGFHPIVPAPPPPKTPHEKETTNESALHYVTTPL